MKHIKLATLAACALLFGTASVMAQGTPKSTVSLKQQVKDLTEAVIMLQKRVGYLESVVPTASIPLMPSDPKLSPLASSGAVFLLGIDNPEGNDKDSKFNLTVVNPQSITYTNVNFKIRVFGKDAEGNPNAYKEAVLVSKITPALEAGKRNVFKFAVPGMPVDNFAAAYVVGIDIGGISSGTAE